MPLYTPSLPTLQGSVNGQTIFLMDAAGNLLQTPASAFRGAGFYTGDALPTEVHPDSGNNASFIDGDFYVYTQGNSAFLYQWDQTQTAGNRWVEVGSLTGTRRHTAISLGVDTFETATTLMNDPITFAAGDTYYNFAKDKTFGPMIAGVGIDFNVENRNYFTSRAPRELTHTDNDPAKLVHTWTPAAITDIEDLAYSPQRGDTYHQEVDNTDHGGYVYTWDEDEFQARILAGDTYAQALSSGWTNIAREFKRAPRSFSETGAPTVNDERYIDGDTYFDTTNLLIYAGYQTGLVQDNPPLTPAETNGQFLLRVWGNQLPTSLGASSIQHTNTPIALDVTYAAEDLVLENTDNTPILYGPYDPLQATIQAAAPYLAVMRAPVTHNGLTTPPTNVVGNISGTRVATGDYYIQTESVVRLTEGKQIIFGPCTVDYSDPALPITWDVGVNNNRPLTFFDGIGSNITNDAGFSAGDFLEVNSTIKYGPYVSGAATAALSWPFHSYTRPYRVIQLPTTESNNYTPATTYGTENGNDVITGDFIEWEVTGTTTGKRVRIGPCNYNPATGVINWGTNRVDMSPSMMHNDPVATGTPARNDADYCEGDYILNIAGAMYGPYSENETTDTLAWPLYRDLSINPTIVDTGNVDGGTVWRLVAVNGVLKLDDGNP